MDSKSKQTGMKIFHNDKVMVLCALFAAISMVCKQFLKIEPVPYFRISFENTPIIMAGIFFGPLTGAMVGFIADTIGCVISGMVINPIINIGSVSIGLVSGLISQYLFRNKKNLPSVCSAVLISHIVGSMILKTAGLYKIGFLAADTLERVTLSSFLMWRIPGYVIIAAVESVLIYTLLRNKAFSVQLGRITQE